ncbi:MAG TPA: hypothetical protein VGL83_19100 [Stellaceae bacterium]|jgi:hypothetical protein
MKQALVLAIATLGMTAMAFAQAPNTGTSPGPHDPNPPMETPDLRLPPPCAATPNLAAAGVAVRPDDARRAVPATGQITPADGTTQCSANGTTQSATLPGSAAASP